MNNDELKTLEDCQRLSIKHLQKSSLWSKFNEISIAINSINPRQILFHFNKNHTIVPCCRCGAKLDWHTDKRQYRQYCSTSCTAKFTTEEKKVKNLEKYGVEWHSQLDGWSDKVKQTSLERYGSISYSGTDAYCKSKKETMIKKYGVEHQMHLIEVKEKIKQTNLEKYGVDNPAKNENIQNKIKQTNLEKYGVEHSLKNKDIRRKIKNTNLKKYGVENPLKNKDIRKKISKTRKEQYYSKETLEKLTNPEWLRYQHHQLKKTIWSIAEELNVSSSNLGKYFQKYNIEVVYHDMSELHRRLYEYYCNQGIYVVKNNRKIITPKELDLYFPNHNLAVEINGFYYHSDKYSKNEHYHLNKLTQCNSKKITLLQFWYSELEEYWDIVINIINSKLQLTNKIFARNTKLQIVSSKEKTKFINQYHIQQSIGSSINIGLYYNNNLVMLATFGKSRFSKKYNYELLRLCTIQNTTVIGGASKLLKYFIKNYMTTNQSIVSYCDRRYSEGNVYKSIGFELRHTSVPSYIYVNKQGLYAGTRYQFQKHLLKDKLKIYNDELSEPENMALNGYQKVWDCGEFVFTYIKKDNNV